MLVYLFRHGEAETRAARDEDRQLTRAGMVACRDVASQFIARAPVVEKIMMSPLERAKQTAVTLRAGFPSLRMEIDPMLKPEQDVHELLEALGSKGVQHIMLVGHNPCLSRLLSLMLYGITDTDYSMGTGELACVAMDDAIPGFGELLYSIKPTGSA